MLVAIDPGNDTSWSLWRAGQLAACGLGDPRRHPLHVADKKLAEDFVDSMVVEVPRIYPHGKARPNDVIMLATAAGRWLGRYETLGCSVAEVAPATWKGQVPKAIHHGRVWGRLSDLEQAVVGQSCTGMAPSKRHNVLDAVGLGLWALGRK